MIEGLNVPEKEIVDFCKRWNIIELSLFGSVLRKDFGSESDIDVLALFASDARWSLLDHVDMQDELQIIFKRKADLVSRHGIEQSRNHIRRKEILETAEVIYAAA